jgi:hypothetical protein
MSAFKVLPRIMVLLVLPVSAMLLAQKKPAPKMMTPEFMREPVLIFPDILPAR